MYLTLFLSSLPSMLLIIWGVAGKAKSLPMNTLVWGTLLIVGAGIWSYCGYQLGAVRPYLCDSFYGTTLDGTFMLLGLGIAAGTVAAGSLSILAQRYAG